MLQIFRTCSNLSKLEDFLPKSKAHFGIEVARFGAGVSVIRTIPRLSSLSQIQPRQHEADQHDGVFRFIETHLKDQPWPQPTDQRFQWLARPLLQNFGLTSLASLYLPIIIIG
jgi:hypothetical protein